MNFSALSVGELVLGIKSNLETNFRQVAVEGEVSNISRTVAGHIYFTLSDEKACVSCALFRGDVLRNSAARNFKDGDRILVSGSVGVYAKRGVFQVIAKRLAPAGKGNLALQFELLKEKFSKMGYFDSTEKSPIPPYPKRIAVITAPYGAALQDFLKVMKRRSLWHDIVIVPAVVQGVDSAASLIEALQKAQALSEVDVIVLTRGGGAMEDLWSFNDEALVEAIYKCSIPVISAVGHQVDYTLCDYVADLRLETPSAAAERLSQPHTEIKRKIEGIGQVIKSLLYHHQHVIHKRLEKINPANLARGLELRLSNFRHRLARVELLENKETLLGLRDKEMQAGELLERGNAALERALERAASRVDLASQLLRSIDPQNVLKRGYSYVEGPNGGVVANLDEYDKLKIGESLFIHFKDGKGRAQKAGS